MFPLAFPADVGANCAVNVVLSPAPSVFGTVIPLMLKPVPDALACEICTLADPEFVNVIVCVPLLETATDPKFTLDGFAPICPCTPVPVSPTAAGEPGALLTIEMLPDAAPVVVGAKIAENDALFPALIVIGKVAPLALNPVPEADICVTVSGPFPAFVNAMVCVELLPTETLPNAELPGLIVSCGCAAVPVPLNPITIGDPGALLAIDTLPVTLPALFGENFTAKELLCPALRVIGAAKPDMLNPVPDALPCEIAMLAVPEFVSVTFTEPLAPTSKLPKLTLDGFAVRLPCTPVPVSAIETLGLFAVLVTMMLPVELPADLGTYCAVKLVL
jgi:hypothetical protein